MAGKVDYKTTAKFISSKKKQDCPIFTQITGVKSKKSKKPSLRIAKLPQHLAICRLES